ncbi:diguanylate cyclase [Allochromatium palmeri]|uniref:diguanylate cyclase n=1 Tax=Allochromatium palmeri TaxID=231048 RepID=A0A6N8E7Y4_9GAMM|nr:diguanylate cyclase [Allochromatium palmeri]MTW20265.1 diguanylate cyclase [Allochromatium palmeri]
MSNRIFEALPGTSDKASAYNQFSHFHATVRARFNLFSVVLLWLLIVAASLGWNLHQAERHRDELARESARSFFDLLLITRRWNARHEGVYVPATPQTPPNPYLKDPRREIQVTDTLTLTKVNPAYMTRTLSELAAERSGVQFHITSLKPIRPQNLAYPWEAAALRAFEQGAKEWAETYQHGDQQGYRYMAPLIAEKPCLKCHAEQGYELGDVRGGISITLPVLAPIPWRGLVISHGLVGLAGAAVILVLGWMLARAYERLRRQAVFDALTSIPNRRFFIEHLVHELRRGRREQVPLGLLICDIDNFKGYNDTFGHQAGDHCLCAVADLLRESLQRGSDFCARYGGEEFVVVLPNTTLDGALRVAERIREAVSGLGIWHPASSCGIVTISIGVAEEPGSTSDLDHESLIRRADEALYRAKELGRNRVEAHRTERPVV